MKRLLSFGVVCATFIVFYGPAATTAQASLHWVIKTPSGQARVLYVGTRTRPPEIAPDAWTPVSLNTRLGGFFWHWSTWTSTQSLVGGVPTYSFQWEGQLGTPGYCLTASQAQSPHVQLTPCGPNDVLRIRQWQFYENGQAPAHEIGLGAPRTGQLRPLGTRDCLTNRDMSLVPGAALAIVGCGGSLAPWQTFTLVRSF
jgi:hypothetical protein